MAKTRPPTKTPAPKSSASNPIPASSSKASLPSPRKRKPTVPNNAPSKSHPPKRAKTANTQARPAPTTLPIINHPPTEILTVLSFGSGECGELGLGVQHTQALTPRVNPFLSPEDPAAFHVVQVACGGMHTVALTADNRVLTWGVNDECALGRDTSWEGGMRDVSAESEDGDGGDDDDDGALNPREAIPTQVPPESFPPHTIFAQVAAGDSCTFVLTDTGLVYGWGAFRNPKGDQRFCYDANRKVIKTQPKPTLMPTPQSMTQLVCGANHVLALATNGRIWGWGSHEQNQLGTRPFGRHQETLLPREVRVCPSPIVYIASGEYHSFAVDKRGNVWAWGLNSFGEAGYAKGAGGGSAILPYPIKVPGLAREGVVRLDGGTHHSAAVTSDGRCFVWGRMDGGQLGIDFTTAQLQDPNIIRQDEYNKPRICLRPTEVPNIGHTTYVACGTDHTIFLNKKGEAHATGFNTNGQLGLGNEDDQDVAQLIGGKEVRGRTLTWAGAGGQFSALATTG